MTFEKYKSDSMIAEEDIPFIVELHKHNSLDESSFIECGNNDADKPKFLIFQNKITARRIVVPYVEASGKRLWRLMIKVKRNIKLFKYFLTLTLDNKSLEENRYHYQKLVRRFFNKLRAYMKRRNKTLKYIWKYEEGSDREYVDDKGKIKKGTHRPHFHCLLNYAMSEKVITEMWGCGFVKLKQIYSDRHLKSYMRKYYSKETKLLYWNVGKRSWSASKGLSGKKVESEWNYLGIFYEEHLHKEVIEWNNILEFIEPNRAYDNDEWEFR